MRDSEQLARYLSGQASGTDREAVNQWARANPANQAELDRLRQAWTPRPSGETWDVDAAWARVAARLDSARPAADVIPIAARRFPVRWLAAAAVLATAGAGIWATTRDGAVEYRTAAAEQRRITLADGSEVTLAPASTLIVDARYGRPARTMTLDGRAFFVVTHDAARPFRVTAGSTVVEDLGTEFEVDAKGPMVKVGVAVGSVAIHRPGTAVINLAAGDLATVEEGTEALVAHETPIGRIKGWTAGLLEFEDRPLQEIAAELARWYGVAVTVHPSVAAKPFTGPLPVSDLDRAVETLQTAFPELAVRRSTDTILIRPGPER